MAELAAIARSSDNPVSATDVTFNILAPGIVQHHITAGGSYKMSDRDTIEFSGLDRHLDIIPRYGDGDEPVAGQETAGRRYTEHALAVHVGQRLDRFAGKDMQRVPGTGA